MEDPVPNLQGLLLSNFWKKAPKFSASKNPPPFHSINLHLATFGAICGILRQLGMASPTLARKRERKNTHPAAAGGFPTHPSNKSSDVGALFSIVPGIFPRESVQAGLSLDLLLVKKLPNDQLKNSECSKLHQALSSSWNQFDLDKVSWIISSKI